MSHSVENSPLGRQTNYVSSYSPALLYPIERALSRAPLGLVASALPFSGVDVWTGYEISWLNFAGKPQVAIGEFRIPCDSPAIIESKSFKLYLNSFNQSRFEHRDSVEKQMAEDLSRMAGASVSVKLDSLADFSERGLVELPGELIDDLDVEITHYHPAPELLGIDSDNVVEETLCSHLLKTNCPVTGQPDWASVHIHYRGKQISRERLLAYIVSFREHQDFHEHCVERIFCDLWRYCEPEVLTIYARYTRRGGLDINPYRSTQAVVSELPWVRSSRQ